MHKIANSPLTVPCYYAVEGWQALRCRTLKRPRVSEAERLDVEENVTFVYKSFNRQRKALRLLRSIKAYYPGAEVVIADDSEKPLVADDARVVRLPFNSGLGAGLAAALELVRTPYVMRMDDDLVLTPGTRVHDHLDFLRTHPEVDLCGVQMCDSPTERSSRRKAARYEAVRMGRALLVPAGTCVDGRTVVGKASNCFLARTESVRKVGWDPNIRMIDHHEFFWRAAGSIVCVQDPRAFVYHCRNPFDWRYRPYRADYEGDVVYIRRKHANSTSTNGEVRTP